MPIPVIGRAGVGGASAATIRPRVVHDLVPSRFEPLNVAPTAGPLAPRSHSTPSDSGDHSPMRVRSETSSQTVLGGAAMSVETFSGVVTGSPYRWRRSPGAVTA